MRLVTDILINLNCVACAADWQGCKGSVIIGHSAVGRRRPVLNQILRHGIDHSRGNDVAGKRITDRSALRRRQTSAWVYLARCDCAGGKGVVDGTTQNRTAQSVVAERRT